MKKLHFFGIQHSFSTPKGFSFADCSDDELKQSITIKKVFLPRIDVFKKVCANKNGA